MSEQVLAGKVALVTGASRGIGAAIARHLARAGATVIVNYSSSADAAEAVVKSIRDAGGNASAIRANVGKTADVEAMFQQIDAHHGGRVDIVVNNAGVYSGEPIGEATTAAYDRMFDVNVRSVFDVTRLALARMPDGGRVINIGSCLGERVPFPGISVYCASKFAVAGFSQAWARELGPRKITVNVVQPGPIDTDMNPADASKNPGADYMRAAVPLGRYGTADEVASAVAYLASPLAAYVTGTTLTVDGGINA